MNHALEMKPADPWNLPLAGTHDRGRGRGLRNEFRFSGRASTTLVSDCRAGR